MAGQLLNMRITSQQMRTQTIVSSQFGSGFRSLRHSASARRRGKSRYGCRCYSSAQSLEQLVLMECDGVLFDLHGEGHRVAFNRVFKDLGLECANWSPQVYHDLLRSGNGTAEGMIHSFFETLGAVFYEMECVMYIAKRHGNTEHPIGWPVAVATSDRKMFSSRVHKQKQEVLKAMIRVGDVPMRDGVEEFVNSVLDAGMRVGVICGTLSLPTDNVVGSVGMHLGKNIADQLSVCYWDNSKNPEESDADSEDTIVAKMQEGLAKMKREEAMAFVKTVGMKEEGIEMGLDPALMAGSGNGISPAWLAAVVVALGGRVGQSVVIAANSSTVKASAGAGLATIAVPAGLSRRGSFPEATSVFDGFGAGGGLTFSRLNNFFE